jgi:hypothetical protein
MPIVTVFHSTLHGSKAITSKNISKRISKSSTFGSDCLGTPGMSNSVAIERLDEGIDLPLKVAINWFCPGDTGAILCCAKVEARSFHPGHLPNGKCIPSSE